MSAERSAGRAVAAFGAVLALLAGLLLALARPAAADPTQYPYLDQDSDTVTAAVGYDFTDSLDGTCHQGSGSDFRVLTSIAAFSSDDEAGNPLFLTAVVARCNPFRDNSLAIDTGTAYDYNLGAAYQHYLDSSCPSGQVITGVAGTNEPQENGSGPLVDLQPYCSPLDDTGHVWGTPVAQPELTGINGVPSGPVFCPAGSFAVGARVDAAAGDDPNALTGLKLECDAPVVDPAVVAATYPHTGDSSRTITAGYDTGTVDSGEPTCGDGAFATAAIAVDSPAYDDPELAGLGVGCTPVTAAGALADATTTPSFEPADPTDPIESASCPGTKVLTGVDVVASRNDSAIGGLQAYCSVLGDDGYPAGDPARTGDIVGQGYDASDVIGTLLCPAGTAVVGMGVSLADGSPVTPPNRVNLQCAALDYGAVRQPGNSSWTTARLLAANDTTTQSLTSAGGSLWYRFPVQPDSAVQVDLSDLPANDDLAVFSDIGSAFTSLENTQDLTKLAAEFASIDAAPTTFSPTTFSPTTFSPTTFSPTTFSPTTFSPTTFSPTTFSPTTFSPTTFSPTTFSPTTFSPTTFSPNVTPQQYFQAGAFADDDALAQAFSAAQTKSLLGVSAQGGTADEGLAGRTQNHTGYFYIRVTGRNGAVSPQPFTLSVTTTGGPCSTPLDTYDSDPTLVGTPGTARTLVLTDSNRLTGPAADVAALTTANRSFASAVDAVDVDVAESQQVQDLQAQADAHRGCPYAENLVAQAIRDIVDSYRDSSGTLRYVVIEGDDSVVPFFRYADDAGVAPESGFVPPVADGTASDSSLVNDTVLDQDAYGSVTDLTVNDEQLPVPDLPVGRLVESPAEIASTLRAYLSDHQAAITPSSTLSTGYDFLAAGAKQVATSFAAADATGRNDTLITNQGVSRSDTTVNGVPSPTTTWTAADLRRSLFGSHHDVVYLAGHFSAAAALAADFTSTITTRDLAAQPTGTFAHTLVFSAGCHSGYNTVDSAGVPGVTDTLDWAQAFAQQGATLVAGTGYQYGDTDFVRYSNDLYARFADALRTGSGPVAVGTALVAAKRAYLAAQATLDGVDAKSVEEATLFGLPMQGVDFPSGRLPAPTAPSPVSTTAATSDPGATLGLSSTSVTLTPQLTSTTKTLTDGSGASTDATYLTGPAGVEVTPAAPALPLVTQNATAPDGTVLRGVGFRSGTYTDTTGVTPLTGAPATETNTVHGPFVSDVFYPDQLATPNYVDALGGGSSGGGTSLLVTPTQYRSDAPGSSTDVQRTFSSLGYSLYYSGNTRTYGANTPAQAAPPSFSGVTATVSDDGTQITFSTHVVGDPSAGIQTAWVTWTDPKAPGSTKTWQSIDLAQDSSDSTLWTATLTLPDGETAGDVQYLVQAVNGVGVVGADDDLGHYYAVSDLATPVPLPTTLTLDPPPATNVVGTSVPLSARLLDQDGDPLAGRAVTFTAPGSGVVAVTDGDGEADAQLPIGATPGRVAVAASFAGTDTLAASSAPAASVQVTKRPTQLTLAPVTGGFRATLQDTTRPAHPVGLPARTAFVVASDSSGTVLGAVAMTTDASGAAVVPFAALPAATAGVRAWFGSPVTPSPTGRFTQTDPLSAAATSATVPVVVDHLRLGPSPTTVMAGYGRAFSATAYRPDGSVLGTVSQQTAFTISPLTGGDSRGASCTGVYCRATTAGTYRVTGTFRGTQASRMLHVLPAAPATVSATAGNGASAAAGSRFAGRLSVHVVDIYGNAVPNAAVTFTVAPADAGSATATFANGARTAVVTTGASGNATAPALSAGTHPGAVSVRAGLAGAGAPATLFELAVTGPGPSRGDLTVTLSAPNAVTAGGTTAVTITVTNHGPAAATTLGAAVLLGAGASVTSLGGGTAFGANAVLFTRARLASGASFSGTIRVSVGRPARALSVYGGALSAVVDPDHADNLPTAVVHVR